MPFNILQLTAIIPQQWFRFFTLIMVNNILQQVFLHIWRNVECLEPALPHSCPSRYAAAYDVCVCHFSKTLRPIPPISLGGSDRHLTDKRDTFLRRNPENHPVSPDRLFNFWWNSKQNQNIAYSYAMKLKLVLRSSGSMEQLSGYVWLAGRHVTLAGSQKQRAFLVFGRPLSRFFDGMWRWW